jgi:hypothetical protein
MGRKKTFLSSCAEAKEFLGVEDSKFSDLFTTGFFGRFGVPNLETREKRRKAPPGAVGFWPIPIEGVGEMPEPRNWGPNPMGWEMKLVLDLRKHRPQLGLFHLRP